MFTGRDLCSDPGPRCLRPHPKDPPPVLVTLYDKQLFKAESSRVLSIMSLLLVFDLD